jgi:hypothetical protein
MEQLTEKSDDRVSVANVGSQVSVHTGKSSISDNQLHTLSIVAGLTANWFDQ